MGPVTPTLGSQPAFRSYKPAGESRDNMFEVLEPLVEEEKRASQATICMVNPIQEAQDKLEANAPRRLVVVNLDVARDDDEDEKQRPLSYQAKLEDGDQAAWLALMIS
jgi:hypothetical protein